MWIWLLGVTAAILVLYLGALGLRALLYPLEWTLYLLGVYGHERPHLRD